MNQLPTESRIEFLARVLHHFMDNSIAGEILVLYDDTMCDGMCLATEISDHLGLSEEILEERNQEDDREH